MCKGRTLAFREMMLYPAILISMYDILPPNNKPWGMPDTTLRAGTRNPSKPIHAWIKRRKFAEEESA